MLYFFGGGEARAPRPPTDRLWTLALLTLQILSAGDTLWMCVQQSRNVSYFYLRVFASGQTMNWNMRRATGELWNNHNDFDWNASCVFHFLYVHLFIGIYSKV